MGKSETPDRRSCLGCPLSTCVGQQAAPAPPGPRRTPASLRQRGAVPRSAILQCSQHGGGFEALGDGLDTLDQAWAQDPSVLLGGHLSGAMSG